MFAGVMPPRDQQAVVKHGIVMVVMATYEGNVLRRPEKLVSRPVTCQGHIEAVSVLGLIGLRQELGVLATRVAPAGELNVNLTTYVGMGAAIPIHNVVEATDEKTENRWRV